MKKIWLAASALALTIGMAGNASALELKAAHYLSPKHPVGVGYQAFSKALKKDSDGSLTVRIFPGGSLLGAKAISDGVRNQVADIGFDVLSYTPSYYPHGVMLIDMAMVGKNDMAATFAITELFTMHCKPCLAEFEKQNQVFTSGMSTSPYVLLSRDDINSAEEIKGKKLRAGGSLWDRFSDFVGATGVNVPSSEIYTSLSRGIIDAAIYAVGGLKSHGLADVTKQVVLLNLGSFRSGNLFSFNRDTWSKLTTAQRAAVFKALPIGVVATVNSYHQNDTDALKLAKEKNIPVLQPDASLTKERDAFVEHDLQNVIKSAHKKLGIEDAAGFVAQYRKLYAKYVKLIEPIRNDPAKLSNLLYEQVYAKLDPATFEVK